MSVGPRVLHSRHRRRGAAGYAGTSAPQPPGGRLEAGPGLTRRTPPPAALAYGPGSPRDEHVKLAVLVGSVIAAALAVGVLLRRNRVYRQIHLDEERDEDGDGIPDMFLTGTE